MDQTPNLALPYILAAQAQKHVTVNETVRALDAILQLMVLDKDLATPPVSPAEGNRYIVAGSPTGAWAGQAGKIAAWQDAAWMFYAPQEGWLAWVADENLIYVYDGAAWGPLPVGGVVATFTQLGVNATPDATNKLAVSSAASLFNHAGAGHQIKINKNAAGDTASILFQTGFSGRAEFGATGDDAWHVKMSADGSAWTEVLRATISGITVSGGNFSVGPHVMSTAMTSGSAAMEISSGIAGDRYAFFDFHASDTQPDYSSRFIRNPGQNANFEIINIGTGGILFDSQAIGFKTSGVLRVSVENAGHLVPATDNAATCGKSGARWSAIWAATGTIQTSDKREKVVADDLSAMAGRMVDTVSPVLYRWKSGGRAVAVTDRKKVSMNPGNPTAKTVEAVETEVVEQPGKRLHAGFLAQDVKAAMDGLGVDFAAWGLDDAGDPESRQWLRYDELLPVLWEALRETRAELAALRGAA